MKSLGMLFREEQMGEHFTKYHIEGLPFDAVIHHFKTADEGLPHDHPFAFRSYIIKGWYEEQIWSETGLSYRERREEGSVIWIPATHIHKITRMSLGGVWTLITPGPWQRHCGFWDFSEGKGKFIPAPPPPKQEFPQGFNPWGQTV
jgi:hypothetical protein